MYQAPAPPPPDVRLVRTDITGFVGFAERGPLPDANETDPGKRALAAVKLNSWDDYRRIFGGFLPYSYLAYAVRGFFATGGKTCYVVRVGPTATATATPPATAVMPLPAAITSKQVAKLAAGAAPGDTEIKLDSPVELASGQSLAISGPAFSQRLVVARIIDSQTIVVQDAQTGSGGLESAYAGGTPVFLLSGPVLETPITSLANPTPVSATRIQIGSSDVFGIAPGSLIAVGDPLNGECTSVASIVDDQTIAVQPALLSLHAAGESVYSIIGSALTAPAEKGDTVLQVAGTGAFAKGALVSVQGGGVTEIRVVTAQPTAFTIQLGLPLKSGYDIGSVVRRYDAAFTVNAMSPGAWGNQIKLAIMPLEPGNAVTHFSLRVMVDPGLDPTQPPQQEFYPLLSLDPNDPSPTPIYAPDIVNATSKLIQICRSTLSICPAQPTKIPPGTFLLSDAGLSRSGDLYLEGGSDGDSGAKPAPAVTPMSNPCNGQTAAPTRPSPPPPYPAPPNAGNQDFRDALDVLGLVDEIGILCCPDAAGPPLQTPAADGGWSLGTIQQAMVAQCLQKQYRVTVLDTPMSLQPGAALNWLNQFRPPEPGARFAAVYYPWIKVPDELGIEGVNRRVPPCGHVAGAYAYTDNHFGVQKAPANVELQFVSDVDLAVTSQQQGFLNPVGVNVIRAFPGRGIRLWGAHSTSQTSDWIYIHTRRLMSMIETSVEHASRWVVFRANDDDVRRMLTHSLNVFLEAIWRAGGLKGAHASEGYFVKCDNTNNTPSTIDAGQLICQVGVAVAAPMEFLVFELSRSVAGPQIVEA
jgi:hypothetical protein